MRVVERILTVCGETHLAGLPCALIRFAGCPLRCRYCDTPGAQSEDAGSEVEAAVLARWVEQSGLRLVLLTGGEPLLQPELPALAATLARSVQVLVETSGACDITPLAAPVMRCVDVKCPGSGEEPRNLWTNLGGLRAGDAVKLVLADRADYEYAKRVIHEHRLGAPVNILLSSAYPLLDPAELARWIIEDRLAEARINVQLHRIFWPALEQDSEVRP